MVLLWHGQPLRFLPIAQRDTSGPRVRFELRGAPGGPREVTREHVPVSLQPLIIGVRLEGIVADENALRARCSLAVRDADEGTQLGVIGLLATGTLPLARGALWLFATTHCRNVTAPAGVRWWRYALAWVHAQRAPSRGDHLRMTAADLRCLNVYYMAARPVYLIGVSHAERTNLFPMDLVGRVGSGEYLLALRATSPAVELMEQSRVIAMSAAPAEQVAAVYALGAHHRQSNIDLAALPFPVQPSLLHGLPALAREFTRELSLLGTHRIGSHVLFVCRVDAEQGITPRQLSHVSAMYAEWLSRRHRPLEALAS